MSYTRTANIGDRGEDRVLGMFTTTNVVAGLGGAAAMWGVSHAIGLGADKVFSPTWWLGTAAIVAGAVAGVILTVKWQGLSVLDKLWLRMFYLYRRSTGTTQLTPPPIIQTATGTTGLPITYSGRVIARPYRPDEELTEVLHDDPCN